MPRSLSAESTRDWIKLKCRQRQEFVIAATRRRDAPDSARSARVRRMASCVAGRRTGFDPGRSRARQQLASLRIEASRLYRPPAGASRGLQWVKPTLVAERSFAVEARRPRAPASSKACARTESKTRSRAETPRASLVRAKRALGPRPPWRRRSPCIAADGGRRKRSRTPRVVYPDAKYSKLMVADTTRGSRRDCCRTSPAGAVGGALSGWHEGSGFFQSMSAIMRGLGSRGDDRRQHGRNYIVANSAKAW